jgi:acyl carrier protein
VSTRRVGSGDVLEIIRPLVSTSAVLTEESDLWNAGMDSIASVSVMVSVEDAFDITFPDELLTREVFKSASAIAAAVRLLLDSGGS